jgi:hypothetical protein
MNRRITLQAAIPNRFSRSHGMAGRFARPTPHPKVTDAAHAGSLARDGERSKVGGVTAIPLSHISLVVTDYASAVVSAMLRGATPSQG